MMRPILTRLLIDELKWATAERRLNRNPVKICETRLLPQVAIKHAVVDGFAKMVYLNVVGGVDIGDGGKDTKKTPAVVK